MSGGVPPRDIQGDPRRIQSFPPALHNHTQNNNDRQPSMSVGYLTITPHNRDHPPDYINNHYIYSQTVMPQQNSNLSQQPPPQGPHGPPQAPQQPIRDHYERVPTGPPSHAGSASSAAASGQQTPRITLPPLSAITDNSDGQPDGPSSAQTAAPSSAQTSFPPQQQQVPQQPPQQPQNPQQPQQQQAQPQHAQAPQGQQHPQASPSYPSRPPSQYESQQGSYPHSQRHLQPSPQQPLDQSRYAPGPGMPQQLPMQQHPMPMQQMQPNPQMGQFPSPAPTPQHFQPQSQYPYPPQQYPSQSMYGQYPPPQMQQQMPPGIPYQPAYATSHRQRPPQFNPYPPPHSGYGPPPPQGPPQGWPQQDYIAQPLTPLTASSAQQPYSPQLNQMSAGGPLRTRRTSSGLSQPSYPPPSGEPPQPVSQPQSTLKPKRKRATSGQLRVLNSVFQSTFFPSTELRIALGKELNMSPRTVQIWFQNKRQSWRATKAKEHGGNSTQQPSSGTAQTSGTPSSSQTYGGSGSFSPHPLRQEHFPAGSSHARMPSSAEESGREEGMENDEGGGWEALRQAQQEHRDYRPGVGSADPEDDVGFDDELHSPHHRHR